MSYFGIHNHTDAGSNLRLRDSTNKVNDLIQYVHDIGMKGLAITDHESIAAHLKALKYYEQHMNEDEWNGFKLALGNEIYLCTSSTTAENAKDNVYPHFILIALDAEGHKGIRELSTKAWVDNSFMSVMYRVPTYYDDLAAMLDKYKGHIVGSSACFVKGTQIETKQGWKNIEDITSNDYVLNRYGTWEKVIEPTQRYYSGLGYNIEWMGTDKTVTCTKDHQFLTITNNNKIPRWVTAQDLITTHGSTKHQCLKPLPLIEYTNNSIIKKEDFEGILFPYTDYSNRTYSLPDEIILTPELMRLFGLFLGDGYITLKKNVSIGFTFNEKEFDVYYDSFVKEAGKQLNIEWYILRRPDVHRVDIVSSSRELIELFYYCFKESKAKDKFIPYCLHVNKELDIELLFGYLLADGYFRIKKNQTINCGGVSGEVVAASISYKLIRDIYNLMESMMLAPCIFASKEKTDSNNVHHQTSWYISCSNALLGKINKLKKYSHQEIVELFTQAQNDKRYITIKDTTYRKMYIKQKTEVELHEVVHCLNNTTHSFKCEDIIVHNCLGGALPRQLLKYRDCTNERVFDDYCNWIEHMNYMFGDGFFFLELQPSESEDQIYVNEKLIELSKATDVPYIISTDAHYLTKGDRSVHKAFLNSQDGDREVDEFYATTYVMTPEEIHSYMDKYLGYEAVQLGLDNTNLIYDKVQYYKLTKDLEIPYIPLDTTEPDKTLYKKYKDKIPLFKDLWKSDFDGDRHMLRELLKAIESHENYQTELGYFKVNECLDYLIKSSEVNKVHWSAYLMQERDYINIAWNTGSLVGAGRGSGVGFCLLYLLGITQIDPLREKTQTFPWRFLNPYRQSVLDIDTDIEGSKRDTVIQALKDTYGADRVSKVLTYQTEQSRSAILTAARGLGIDNDTASYIASLVVFDRGMARSLSTMYYGNEEYKPSAEFVREMNAHPDLWETARKIEGLICGCGQHAGGVIICDKPLTESTGLMRTKSGDIVTQYDLHILEDVSLIKIDLLAIDALEKIHAELDLLLEYGEIEWQGSLRDTYEKYVGVYTLERDAEDMWKMLWEHKVLSFFQMEKESGKKAIALAKPHSVDDLATLNSVIRLMAQEKGAEQPLQKFARFKNDINEWYKEMDAYGLTQEEQDILKDILGASYGICEAQEYLILLTEHPKIGGFNLIWSDKLRKSVAKKAARDFDKLEQEFFANAEKKHLSEKLVNYVWNVLIMTQRGYGFDILDPLYGNV